MHPGLNSDSDEISDSDCGSEGLQDCEGDSESVKEMKKELRFNRMMDQAEYLEDLESGFFL